MDCCNGLQARSSSSHPANTIKEVMSKYIIFVGTRRDIHCCAAFALQNFDLGPSLVDEVMKAFGSSGKAERSEKLPVNNRSTEDNFSSAVTTPSPPEELKPAVKSSVVHSFNSTDKTAHEDTFVSAKPTNCDAPDVKTSAAESEERCLLRNGAAGRLKSSQVLDVQSESLLRVPTASADTKCNGDVEKDDATPEVWQQQQLEKPVKKSEQLSASIHRNSSGDDVSLPAGSRYPAVIGNCSLSPRPAFPRESAVRGLSATKNSSSSTLSSSSEERIPVGMRSRVSASLVAASSSSLPARPSLVRESWSKLPRLAGTKVPSGDSSDSESGNLLQRLKGKASLSRFSGLRLSIDSRTAKSGLPTQNLNVNVHFFNRLREQELQNSTRSEEDDERPTAPADSDSQKQSSSSLLASKHLPSLRLDTTGSHSRVSEHQDTDSSGVETVSGGTDGVSLVFSPHDEVARLSCQSTESHDSFSHDSEHSSITTQPSDEGVYSDDSVAASADELRPRTEQRTLTSRSTAAATTAIKLGISDKRDVFWTCPVNFRDFVSVEENRGRNEELHAAERYRP